MLDSIRKLLIKQMPFGLWMWVKLLSNGTKYSISDTVISLLSVGDFEVKHVVEFILRMFDEARLFGVPGDLRSVWVHGSVSYRHVYGYVMYIRRYRSVSLHISSGRIRRDFGKCAAYWGWQVLAHEIAHLVGVGGGRYLGHGNVHLSVTRELLLNVLPVSISAPATYYLFLDYSLSNCKRGYSRVDGDSVISGLRKMINDFAIDESRYINCSGKLRNVINSCGRKTLRRK